jgi:hypothetical protein
MGAAASGLAHAHHNAPSPARLMGARRKRMLGPPYYMYMNEGVVTILSNNVGKPGQPDADCFRRLCDT